MRRYPPIGRRAARSATAIGSDGPHRYGLTRSLALAAVVSACIATAAHAQSGTALPVPARLRIESSPSGAAVFLDDRLVGVTPLDIDDLFPGRRRVRIEYRGYRAYDEWVSLSAGVATEVTATLDLLTGLLEIESDHNRLEMNLGGTWEPARAVSLPVGTYSVAFRAFGYEVGERFVTIGESTPTVVAVRLDAAPFSISYVDPSPLRFHPDNLGRRGVADMTVSAAGPGWYRIEIRDADRRLLTARRGAIDRWRVPLSWDGRDGTGRPVPDGLYYATVVAGNGERQTRVTRSIEVTHTARLYPRLITPYGSGSSLVPFPGGRGNGVASFSVGGGYEYRESGTGVDHTVPLTLAARVAPIPRLSGAAGSFIAAGPEDDRVRSLSYGYLELGPSYRVPGGVGLSLYGNGGTGSIGPWRANRIGAAVSWRTGSLESGFGLVASPAVEASVALDRAPNMYGAASVAAIYDSPRSMVAISSRLTADIDRWRTVDVAFDSALRSAAGSILWAVSLGMSLSEASTDDPTLWSLVSVGATY